MKNRTMKNGKNFWIDNNHHGIWNHTVPARPIPSNVLDSNSNNPDSNERKLDNTEWYQKRSKNPKRFYMIP